MINFIHKLGIPICLVLEISLPLEPKAFAVETGSQLSALTLQKAKILAVENSLALRNFTQKKEVAKSRSHVAYSSYYPSLGIVGGISYEAVDGFSETNPLGFAVGKINLFNGFQDQYDIEISKLEIEKIDSHWQLEKFIIEINTEELFWRFLYLRDLIQVNNGAIDLNEQHSKMLSRKIASGLASQTDKINFKLKKMNLQSEILSLKQDLESSRIQLRSQLGLPIESPIQPVGNLQLQKIVGSIKTYLNTISEHSFSNLLVAKDRDISLLVARKKHSLWLPTIDFQSQFGFLDSDDKPQESDKNDPAVNLLLTFNLELFSGNKSLWERNESEALYQSSLLDLQSKMKTSINEMEIQFSELKFIEERIQLTTNYEKMRVDFYNSMLKEYKRGYKEVDDVSDAAHELILARTKKIQLKYEFLVKRLALERSYGAAIKVNVVQK